MAIEVFNRTEIKYLLNDTQKNELEKLLAVYMNRDPYNKDGKTYSISNLYLDTPSDEMIIKSLEKPVYKEKLRLRSYGQIGLDDNCFLEIKKKFRGVVNKRRTTMTLAQAYEYFSNGTKPENTKMNQQVFNEIDYMMKFYRAVPKVFISYDRLAYFAKEDSDFRLTLDRNIQTRRTDLRLDSPAYGNQLLEEGQWLMEAKAFKAFPLWFVKFLSANRIYSSSFSKYGTEYTRYRTAEKNKAAEK